MLLAYNDNCSYHRVSFIMTFSNIFNKIFTLQNILDAIHKCANNVRWKASVSWFESKRLINAIALLAQLRAGTYKPGNYVIFDIWEPKHRTIASPRFVDRVVHRAICDVYLYDELTKHFIYDNCACLKGKGIDFALKRMRVLMQNHFRRYGLSGYVCRIDIKSYFQSIPRDKVKQSLIDKNIDQSVLNLIFDVLDSFPVYDDKCDGFGIRGLALGSQLSQLLALNYLDKLDHLIKDKLGIKGYIRYMDDLVILCPDKKSAKCIMSIVSSELNKLGLTLNPKSTIHPFRHGISFLKFKHRVTTTGGVFRLPSNKALHRECKRLRHYFSLLYAGIIDVSYIRQHLMTWQNHMDKSESHRRVRIIEKLFNDKLRSI